MGCPIRTPADQCLFATPRSFSQLITSFFASESLGILHTLFLTSLFYLCARLIKHRSPFSSFQSLQVSHAFLLLFLHHVNELHDSL